MSVPALLLLPAFAALCHLPTFQGLYSYYSESTTCCWCCCCCCSSSCCNGGMFIASVACCWCCGSIHGSARCCSCCSCCSLMKCSNTSLQHLCICCRSRAADGVGLLQAGHTHVESPRRTLSMSTCDLGPTSDNPLAFSGPAMADLTWAEVPGAPCRDPCDGVMTHGTVSMRRMSASASSQHDFTAAAAVQQQLQQAAIAFASFVTAVLLLSRCY